MTVDFDKFFYVFHADTGEIYPDIRNSCLDVGQFAGKRLIVSLICVLFLNKSSHPKNCSRFASLVFLYNIYVLCCRTPDKML
jgi:hypothetical protein